MHRKTGLGALLAALLGGSVLNPVWADDTPSYAAQTQNQVIDNQYIVTLAPNIVEQLGVTDLTTAIRTLLATVGGGEVLYTYQHALTGMTVRLTDLQATLLGQLPGVIGLEPDRRVQAIATQANATWGLDRVDQPALPLDGSYQYPNSAGNDVTVYVIDTGLRASHNEFSGRVSPGRNFVSSGGGFLFGGGSVDPANTNDCNGHGTHVAGTATGTVYGVAKQAQIAPVRVLDCNGSGSNSGVIAGVDWVAGNHRKPAVANMSLGGGSSSALDTAVRNAVSAGVSMVVAAGNDNTNACNGSPNRVAEALTVGATTRTDQAGMINNAGSQSPNRLLQVAEDDGGTVTDRLPTAAFTAQCSGTICQFDASGSSDDIGVAAWDWALGDGNVASGEQISHDYGTAGNFTVTLTVTDTANQTASIDKSVISEDTSNPCPECTRYEGNLGNGSSVTLPSGGFSYGGGNVEAYLYSPAGGAFSLALEQRSCFLFFGCRWSQVGSAQPQNGVAELNGSVGSGTYRWRVTAQSGSGAYTLLANPR